MTDSHLYTYASQSNINPLFTRMGDNFVLADFMYNDSVIRKGDANYMPDFRKNVRLSAHIYAMSAFANTLVDNFGLCSISYGFISPEQSERRVKWKDPTAPSYHRWDDGCAADFIFHGYARNPNDWFSSTVYLSTLIMEKMDVSRMITYSESPYICLSTGTSPTKAKRNAIYWNVYEGKERTKPAYYSLSKNDIEKIKNGMNCDKLIVAKALIRKHASKGESYPTYHGGGVKQVQHIRLGSYLMLSDILRPIENVCVSYSRRDGPRHCRPPIRPELIDSLKLKATVLNNILEHYYETPSGTLTSSSGISSPPRISILSAYHGLAAPFFYMFEDMEKEETCFTWDDNVAEVVLSMTSQQGDGWLVHLKIAINAFCTGVFSYEVAEVGASSVIYLRYEV